METCGRLSGGRRISALNHIIKILFVYRANLSAEKERILDLDESIQLDCFVDFILQTWQDINNYYSEEKPEFTPETFRAVYFDYYKQINNIVIVKYTFSKTIAGYGKRREKKEIKIIKDFSRILGLSYHETQICVSDKNCIENVEIVYNGEDEVI